MVRSSKQGSREKFHPTQKLESRNNHQLKLVPAIVGGVWDSSQEGVCKGDTRKTNK